MKKIALIPARYAATRFPYKLMQPLGNKTVIRHTYDNTVATDLFDDVIVVTDHQLIFDDIVNHGGKAMMSIKTHESGSDRIAEAVKNIDTEIVLNVQGDEPFVQKEPLQRLLQVFEGEGGREVKVASLMKKFTDPVLVADPNYVKVMVNRNNWSLLFSRSIIPFHRDQLITPSWFEHIGVYAFRKQTLLDFTTWPVSEHEAIEKLEQLRYLDNGIMLKMVETFEPTVKIDVPADLKKASDYLELL